MFHPMYNADGSLSKFRTACLIIIAICMASAGVMQLLHNDSNDVKEASTVEVDESVNAQKTAPMQGLLAEAVVELQNTASYLSSCGLLNQGFEGCEVSFSKTISDNFFTKSELAEDGYSLELKAKKTQHCALLRVVNDEYFAFDEQGQAASDCLQALNIIKTKSVAHDYDVTQGQPAPSGFVPVLSQTAENRKIDPTL